MTTATKERPILFKGALVRAIIDGRKTVTRRILTPAPACCERIQVGEFNPTIIRRDGSEDAGPPTFGAFCECGEYGVRCPFGSPGDRLWVRESFCYERDPITAKLGKTLYEADGEDVLLTDVDGFIVENADGTERKAWQSPIMMPRLASRLTLEVVSVRVEKLQHITEEDALNEGAQTVNGFAVSWDKTHGCFDPDHGSKNPKRWATNPWIWRIEFKKIGEPK